MELLKELLGFVVLTGPLLLIIVWLPVSLWAATKISKRYTCGSLKRKFSIGVLLFIAIFLIPFADGIAGRFYFNYLCATKAGVKVYQTVELPAEYWDEEGSPRFKVYGGADNRSVMFKMSGEEWEDARFEYGSFTTLFSKIFHIDEAGFRLRERQSEKTIGEILYFRYWGGWLSRNFSPSNSAISCDMENFNGWKYEIFIPETAK